MGISRDEFETAVKAGGYSTPSREVYRHFSDCTNDFSRGELAMFLAQLMHESGGFQYTEEINYVGRKHHGSYVDDVGLPDKDYHGRGYIQLTWGANYKAASKALGMGDRLLRHPKLVAEDKHIAMAVSVWFWKARVRPQLRKRENCFGTTTMAINGPIECSGGNNSRARGRYKLYLKVAKALGIRNIASECGCYN